MLACELADAAVDCVQAPPEFDRRQPRQTKLVSPHRVVAVARVVDRVEYGAAADRLVR
jgi:hypothetical protein